MSLEVFANIAEIIGVIIVVVTLIYLAIQTKQNNDFLAAQARFNLVERRASVSIGGLSQYMQESIHKYAKGEPVSPAEKGVALFTALRTIELWEWQFGEYQAGMLELRQLPVGAWRAWYRGVDFCPVPIQEAWEYRKDVLNPDFVKFVDENVIAERSSS
jgi:hypothetical protein